MAQNNGQRNQHPMGVVNDGIGGRRAKIAKATKATKASAATKAAMAAMATSAKVPTSV